MAASLAYFPTRMPVVQSEVLRKQNGINSATEKPASFRTSADNPACFRATIEKPTSLYPPDAPNVRTYLIFL